MKKQANTLLLLFLLLTAKIFCQITGNDTSSLKGEFMIDDTKLGSINYSQPFAISTHVIVLLRKGTNMRTGAIDKGLVFTNSLAEPDNTNSVFCFIEQNEIDDAIRALQFINDSLLIRIPDHDVEYTYNFPNSPEQLFVYYNIYFAERKPKWTIVFDFDRNINDANWIIVDNKDCAELIELFKAAKDRLKKY